MNSTSTGSSQTILSGFADWWHSDWGPGPLIRLALPLMISAGFVSVTLFTDRTLLYWQSETAASAAMGAGTVYWSMICLPMGLLGYISTFVSQYRGAQQPARIGVAYQHALRLAWMIVPLLLLAILMAGTLFTWAGHPPQLVAQEATYLRVLLVGGIGVLFYSVQGGLLTGQGRTPTVLAIDGVATIVNLILDVVLIFGFGPIPELGILGAGLATTLSFWLKIPLASWVIARDRQLIDHYRVATRVPWEADMFRRLFVYGTPAGLQMLAEAGCFSVIMLQVGRIGERAMAATTLALGLNVLVFVPMIGLGIGVGVLVGQHLTEGRTDLARRTVSCALGVTTVYTGIFVLCLGLAPNAMLAFYAWGTPAERFDSMRPMLLPLLKIIAFYCVVDGLQVVFVGAIKGAGDTWFVLLATLAVSSGAVLVGLACQHYLGASLMLWWYIIAGWVASMGI
ncbi:MAG: MATE family efflux transporter, partial [Planctomycetales bacterium]|nr:MATE family efflux transporter [Planctomycetales bacterium]